MSYTVNMEAEKVNLKIPISELPKLVKQFGLVRIVNSDFPSEEGEEGEKNVSLEQDWEEDDLALEGKLIGDMIVFNSEQHGIFKNSSDGGLGWLLEKYKGSGEVKEVGEDGEAEFTKYVDGKAKKGKVVFE